jgi:acetyl-CoA C-acetyltransferase
MKSSKVFFIGGSQTDFERNWTKEGKNEIAILREVVEDGLRCSKISFDDISDLNKRNRVAIFVGNFIGELYVRQGHLGGLLTEVHSAFYGVPSARYEAACASSSVALDAAITKIRSGDYDLAIVIGWELMKTVDSKTGGDYLGYAALREKEAEGIEFPFPKLFGKLASELLKRSPLNKELFLQDLAHISNKNYQNAKRNRNSQTRKWFMSEEHASDRGSKTNPFVGELLSVTDCSQVTDGAAMVVLASERFVEGSFPNENFPFVKGWGHRVAPMSFEKKMDESRSSKYVLPWTRQAIIDAYGRAKLSFEDMNVFETHDCFTSSEYAALSAFGFCIPGEEHRVLEEGLVEFKGAKPINPSGGLIGCGHPVGGTGTRMFLDVAKQVAGIAEGYQVRNCDNGIMLNIGGSATSNYVFIIGR